MNVQWVLQCLEQNTRLPEIGLHLPGGAPILLGMEDPTGRAGHDPESSRSGEVKVSPSKPQQPKRERESPKSSKNSAGGTKRASGSTAGMSTGKIADVFKKVPEELVHKVDIIDYADLLAEHVSQLDASLAHGQHGTYTALTWKNLFLDWREKKGRFALLGYDKKARLPADLNAVEERIINGEGSATPVSKKAKRNAYSEEEEREMAAYIRGRLPVKTGTGAKDWEAFAVNVRHSWRARI